MFKTKEALQLHLQFKYEEEKDVMVKVEDSKEALWHVFEAKKVPLDPGRIRGLSIIISNNQESQHEVSLRLGMIAIVPSSQARLESSSIEGF